MKSSLGDRIKNNYEQAYKTYLPWRMPVIIRIDGKNFHSYTKRIGAKTPFDETFMKHMQWLASELCKEIATTVFAYGQSDEISLLLQPYKKLDSEPYFRNEVQKIVSVAAGTASAIFSRFYDVPAIESNPAVFDARCFVLPEAEVVNYFIWRQQDATTNSISMVAQSKFSHKELHGKNGKQMQEMMFQKDGTNWDKLPIYKKRGYAVYKKVGPYEGVEGDKKILYSWAVHPEWMIDTKIPIFSKRRSFIDKWLKVEED